MIFFLQALAAHVWRQSFQADPFNADVGMRLRGLVRLEGSHEVIGKMVGRPLGWGEINPISTPYIRWVFIGSQSPFPYAHCSRIINMTPGTCSVTRYAPTRCHHSTLQVFFCFQPAPCHVFREVRWCKTWM